MPKGLIAKKAAEVIEAYQHMAEIPVVEPPIPVEDIIERYLGVRLGFIDFEEKHGMKGVLGATYVEKRLICVNERLLDDRSEGRMCFTCAHEVAHWILHRPFVKTAKRSGPECDSIICRTVDAKKPIEWQADFFAACLLMPERMVRESFSKAFGMESLELHNVKSSFRGSALYFDPSVENWNFIAAAVREAGDFSNVSLQAVNIRLQELGLLVNLTGVQMGWNSLCSR